MKWAPTLQQFGRLVYRPPERVDDLQLAVSNPAERAHFAVDPGWPPSSSDYGPYVPSHHPTAEFLMQETAAQEAPRVHEEDMQIRLRVHEEAMRRIREMERERERREREGLEELRRLNEAHAKLIGSQSRRRRRSVYTVVCPICHADRFEKCVGTFNRSSHAERFALAWPED